MRDVTIASSSGVLQKTFYGTRYHLCLASQATAEAVTGPLGKSFPAVSGRT